MLSAYTHWLITGLSCILNTLGGFIRRPTEPMHFNFQYFLLFPEGDARHLVLILVQAPYCFAIFHLPDTKSLQPSPLTMQRTRNEQSTFPPGHTWKLTEESELMWPEFPLKEWGEAPVMWAVPHIIISINLLGAMWSQTRRGSRFSSCSWFMFWAMSSLYNSS